MASSLLWLFFDHVTPGGLQSLSERRTDSRQSGDDDLWTEIMDRAVISGQNGRREDLQEEGGVSGEFPPETESFSAADSPFSPPEVSGPE